MIYQKPTPNYESVQRLLNMMDMTMMEAREKFICEEVDRILKDKVLINEIMREIIRENPWRMVSAIATIFEDQAQCWDGDTKLFNLFCDKAHEYAEVEWNRAVRYAI